MGAISNTIDYIFFLHFYLYFSTSADIFTPACLLFVLQSRITELQSSDGEKGVRVHADLVLDPNVCIFIIFKQLGDLCFCPLTCFRLQSRVCTRLVGNIALHLQ